MKYNVRITDAHTANGHLCVGRSKASIDIVWATEVPASQVLVAVEELLRRKQNDPETFWGSIIVEDVGRELGIPACEEPAIEDRDEVPEEALSDPEYTRGPSVEDILDGANGVDDCDHPEHQRCPSCNGNTEGTGRIITNRGTKQCPDLFHVLMARNLPRRVTAEIDLPLSGGGRVGNSADHQ